MIMGRRHHVIMNDGHSHTRALYARGTLRVVSGTNTLVHYGQAVRLTGAKLTVAEWKARNLATLRYMKKSRYATPVEDFIVCPQCRAPATVAPRQEKEWTTHARVDTRKRVAHSQIRCELISRATVQYKCVENVMLY